MLARPPSRRGGAAEDAQPVHPLHDSEAARPGRLISPNRIRKVGEREVRHGSNVDRDGSVPE